MIAGKAVLGAIALAVAAVALAGLAGACSSAAVGPSPAGGRPGVVGVVAAERQYGDVAAQVGGAYVRVTSVLNDPNTDPHSFEISTSVARSVARAALVVQNGLGYDDFMGRIEAASPAPGRRVIDVAHLVGRPADTANPHLWYDPATMAKVAVAVASDLAATAPGRAAYFRDNAARFVSSLEPVEAALANLRARRPGFPVATTEPVADYLLAAAGARNLTPYSFQADVMNGVDPAPQDLTIQSGLLAHRRVDVLVYNEQVTDSLTEGFIRQARRAGVPVVGVYEIEPAGESYQQWMLSTVRALGRAVERP